MKKGLFLKEAFSSVQKQGISMRKRFSLYLITSLISVIAILFLFLSLFGVLNYADNQLEHTLTQQLDYSTNRICNEMDQLAAYAVEFSEQMSMQIEALDIPFENLQNNSEALSALQQNAYTTVFNNLRLADCSGAFFMLNTTVNDSLEDTYYSGIYLKYANVGSDMMLRNSVCMFRGNSQVARHNNINLFSTWECETKAGTFPQMEAVFNQAEADPSKGYLLTPAYKLPEAWEKVRFLCTPIADKKGNIIGVCGFEISDPYFQSLYPTSDIEQKFMVCALLEKENDVYTGQIAPNQSGYAPTLQDEIRINNDDRFSVFLNKNMALIGKTEEIQIGSSRHTVAIMLPKSQYNAYVRNGQIKTVLLFVGVAVLSLFISVLSSRQYVKPLLKSMKQIKTKQFGDNTHIPEINDLFDFLAEQDRSNEIALTKAEKEKADALIIIEEMQGKYNEASKQAERLAYSRRDEVDPYDYENFKKGIETLTRKEKEIFDLYLAGKSAKEIAPLVHIQESTLKFHNHNILGKLGVSSRKQMLHFAALMKREEGEL